MLWYYKILEPLVDVPLSCGSYKCNGIYQIIIFLSSLFPAVKSSETCSVIPLGKQSESFSFNLFVVLEAVITLCFYVNQYTKNKGQSYMHHSYMW